MRAARSATGSGRGDAGRDESRPRAVRAWWPSMPSLPSSARQLLGPEEPGVDRDRDEDPGHQDERESRRGRVVTRSSALTQSPSAGMNVRIVPAKTPGRESGNVTRRNAPQPLAYRSLAASMSLGSIFSSAT